MKPVCKIAAVCLRNPAGVEEEGIATDRRCHVDQHAPPNDCIGDFFFRVLSKKKDVLLSIGALFKCSELETPLLLMDVECVFKAFRLCFTVFIFISFSSSYSYSSSKGWHGMPGVNLIWLSLWARHTGSSGVRLIPGGANGLLTSNIPLRAFLEGAARHILNRTVKY